METTLESEHMTSEKTPGRDEVAQSVLHETDIAIIGGGLAGSLAAAMLGRADIDTVLIDPRSEYPPDFRCEKLDGGQVAILKKTGLAEAVLRVSTPDHVSWVARNGRLVDKRPGDQEGIFYAPLVNTMRAEISPSVRFMLARATALTTSANRQTVTLSNGDRVSARLIMLANGLNVGLRDQINLKREILSPCHSISIGFDMMPVGRREFEFPALTYYAERTSDRTALITLFPIGAVMRANLFVYRRMDDPWLQRLRADPVTTLRVLMPRLGPIVGEFAIEGHIKIRPVDLYITRGHLQPGVVLVGDTFSTSCPAAGTGARKVLNDVERLCNVYIPQWLATPCMDLDKIATFYDDPLKRACDRFSFNKATSLKAFSIDNGFKWKLRRQGKFLAHYGRGKLRRLQSPPVTASEPCRPMPART